MLQNEILNCTKCPLYKSMPYGCKPVPGVGPSDARIFIIGEALGEDEAILSKPFIGQCGKLLDKMLKEAEIDRNKCFISNTVKCRPIKTIKTRVSNRPPTKEEIQSCKDWLFQEIDLIRPNIIFTLGMVPTRVLLGLKSTAKLGDYIGQESRMGLGYPPIADFISLVVPMYHPSYIMAHSRKDYETTVSIFKRYKTY